MKFIVNSKYFAATVNTAVKNNCLGIGCNDNHVVLFFGEKPIEMQAHTQEKSQAVDFDRIQWWRVMKFCKRLQEQPITVDVSHAAIVVYNEMIFRK